MGPRQESPAAHKIDDDHLVERRTKAPPASTPDGSTSSSMATTDANYNIAEVVDSNGEGDANVIHNTPAAQDANADADADADADALRREMDRIISLYGADAVAAALPPQVRPQAAVPSSGASVAASVNTATSESTWGDGGMSLGMMSSGSMVGVPLQIAAPRNKREAAEALRKQRQMLRQSERMKRGLMSASMDPEMVVGRTTGDILMANDAAEALFAVVDEMERDRDHDLDLDSDDECDEYDDEAHENEGLVGRQLHDLIDDAFDLDDFVRRALAGRIEVDVHARGGGTVPCEVNMSEIKHSSAGAGGGVDGGQDEPMVVLVLHDLTRRRRNEAERERRRQIAEGQQEASFDFQVTLDHTGKIESANRAAAELMRCEDKSDLIGRSIGDLFVVGEEEEEEDDGCWSFPSFLRRHLHNGISEVSVVRIGEQEGERHDGTAASSSSIVPVDMGVREIPLTLPGGGDSSSDIDGGGGHKPMYCVFMHSLERRKKSDAEKLRRSRIAEGILESALDPELTFGADGKIQTENRAAADVFGYDKSDMIGMDVGRLFYPDGFSSSSSDDDDDDDDGCSGNSGNNSTGSARRHTLSEFIANHEGTAKHETTALTSSGTSLPVELTLRRIPLVVDSSSSSSSSSEECLYVLSMHDLTKRRRNEAEKLRRQRIAEGILESALDPELTFGIDGIIRTSNGATAEVFGYDGGKEEVVGRNVGVLFDGGWPRGSGSGVVVGPPPPASSSSSFDLGRFLSTYLGRRKVETSAYKKDGADLPVELCLREIPLPEKDEKSDVDGRIFVCSMHSLERRRASDAEKLRRSRIAEGILESALDPELTFGIDGTVQTANGAAADAFGYDKSDMAGGTMNVGVLFGRNGRWKRKNSSGGAASAGEGNENASVSASASASASAFDLDAFIGAFLGEEKRETVGWKKDGTELPVEMVLREIPLPGNERIFVVSMHSLERRKASDVEKLRRRQIAEGQQEASFDFQATFDHSGKIESANRAAADLLECSKDDLLGRNVSVLFEGVQIRRRRSEHDSDDDDHGDDHNGDETHEGEQWNLSTFLERYLGHPRETIIRTRPMDGKGAAARDVPVELGIKEIPLAGNGSHYCMFLHSLERRKRSDKEKLRRRRIAEGQQESSFDFQATFDASGTIKSANRAAAELLRCSKDDLVGRSIAAIFGSEKGDGGNDGTFDVRKFIDESIDRKRETRVWRRAEAHGGGGGDERGGSGGSAVPVELGLREIKLGGGGDDAGKDGEDESLYVLFLHSLERRKRSDAEKLRKQRIIEGVMEASYDPDFTIDETGSILMVNGAAERVFGYSQREFLDGNLTMIMKPADGDSFVTGLERFILTGGESPFVGHRYETTAKKKSGEDVPVEMGLTEIRVPVEEDGDENGGSNKHGRRLFCCAVHDLTRRKRNEEALARKQRITEGIINASFDAMVCIDDGGVIKVTNKAVTDKLGWTEDDVLGKNISMILFDEDHTGESCEATRRSVKNWIHQVKGTQRETEVRRKGGGDLPVMLGLSEVDCQGQDHLYVAFLRDLTSERQLAETRIEKEAAEDLLLNMLPESVAERLKADPSHIADHYTSTTIVFADIVGFTDMCSRISPVETVKILNNLFSRFDEILDVYGLNKVKTIGDCYMATSIPGTEDGSEACASVCHFAFCLLEAIDEYNAGNPGIKLQLRVGVNTGPVVAGIVGTKRFLYDLWGDAVNLASRMESTGVPNKIQVSKDVIETLRGTPQDGDFTYKSRGSIHVKGKGDMETFLLLTRDEESPLVRNIGPNQRKSIRVSNKRSSCHW